MKKEIIYIIYCTLVLLFTPYKGFAQTGNFVKTKTFLDETGTMFTTEVQYYDGLGRPHISSANGLSGNGVYTYSLTEYDCVGRESLSWYPVNGSNTLELPTESWIRSASQTTYSDNSAYISTEYDGLNRKTVLCQGGDQWTNNNKNDSINYSTNGYEEVIKYKTTSTGIIQSGFWAVGTLTVETFKDEDGHWRKTYKNVLGDVVLEDNAGAKTYYVYNNRGLLSYVLTPEYQTNNDIDKYTYKYEYDEFDRMSLKQLPGCDPTIYRYDLGDRVVITQDPLLREKSLYRFTLYDELGRIAVQGTCQQYISFMLNGNLSVVFNPGNSGIGGSCYSFVNTSLPSFIVNPEIEVVNYYDNYAFFLQFSSSSLYGNFSNLNAMRPNAEAAITGDNTFNAYGQKTGEIVATSDGSLLYSSYFYDRKGRLVEDHHSTLDGKVYKIFTEYSFTDKPTRVTKVIPVSNNNNMIIAGQTANATNDYTLTTSYSYNSHNDQLESVSVQCGNNAPVVVSQISYDDLGRIHSNSHPEINDVINYEYDLHGWTTGINGTYFKETLHYADGPSTTKYYNGNISAQTWMGSNDSIQRGYKFRYNERNMLYQASYGEGNKLRVNSGRYNESITEFDSNGAIKQMTRKGMRRPDYYAEIDKLVYDYDGNKVTKIRDQISTQLSYNGAFEYRNTHNATDADPDFTYNSAGMLTSDRDKQIDRIAYNNVGLVDSILFDSGAKVEYTYGLNGEKLKVVHRVPESNISGTDLGNGMVIQRPIQIEYNTREYIGGDIELEGENTRIGKSYKYYFGDGYVQFYPGETTSPKFYFYSKDHLGNVRSVVTKNPSTNVISEIQQTHYYPFGGIIADLSTGRNVQNKLYNGKELDASNNLWWYDYETRPYDPTRGQFTNYDQHCENYYSTNPLTYCHNRPNMLIDPDGMDDFYDKNGNFIGTNRAETDNIYIANIKETIIKNNIKYSIVTDKINISDADNLSAEVLSRIYTNILDRAGFDVSNLLNGALSIYKFSTISYNLPIFKVIDKYNEDGVNAQKKLGFKPTANGPAIGFTECINGKYRVSLQVYPKGTVERQYLSTVSNIISLAGIHELREHGINGLQNKDHFLILKRQRNDISWTKTTTAFKLLYENLEQNNNEYRPH